MTTSRAEDTQAVRKDRRRKRKERAVSRTPEPKNIVSGAGQPLDLGVRRELEERLGYDFGQVRLHTDRDADALTGMLGADAVAVGRDIFFREGAYLPGTADGQRLLAHELLHTVQNPHGLGALRAGRDLGAVSLPQQAVEREAESAAQDLVREGHAPDVAPGQETPGWLRYATVDADRRRLEELDPATLVDRLANGVLRSLRGDPADLSGRVRLQLARMAPRLQESVLDRLEARLLSNEYDRLLDLAEESEGGPVELGPAGVPGPEIDLFEELGVERTRWKHKEEADRSSGDKRADDAREERRDARARDDKQGGDRSRARADAAAEDQEAARRQEQEDERAQSRERAEQEQRQEEEKQAQDRERVDAAADEGAEERQEGAEQAKEERKAQRDREERDPEQANAPGADKRKRKDDAKKPAAGSKQENLDPKAKAQPGPVRPEKVDERAEQRDSALSQHGLHEKDEDEGEPLEAEKPLGLEAGADREIDGGENGSEGGKRSSLERPQTAASAPSTPSVGEIELSEDSSPNAIANALAFPEPVPDEAADGGQSAANGQTTPGERSEPEESDATDTGQDQAIGPDPEASDQKDPAPEPESPGSLHQPDGAGGNAGDGSLAREAESPGAEERPDAQEALEEAQGDKDRRKDSEEREERAGEGRTRDAAADKRRVRSSVQVTEEEHGGSAGPAPASGLVPAGPRTERTPVEDRRPSPAAQRATEPAKGDHDAPAPKSVIPKETGAGAAPSGTVGGSESAGPSAASGPGSAPSAGQAAVSPAAEQTDSPGRLGAPAPEGAKAQPEASLEKDGGGCAPPEPAAEKEEGGGGCGGGGGAAGAPEEKHQEPPDVSGQDPKAAIGTVSKLAPDQALAAMPGVDAAADKKVGQEQRRLDANPPKRERPSGAPRTMSGPPEAAPPAAQVTGKVEKIGPEEQGEKQRAKGSEKAQGQKPTDTTPPPPLPVAKELSAEEAKNVEAAADAVPTVDPELRNKTVGPAPKIRLEGASDPKRTDDQARALKEKQSEIQDTGRQDAAKPMGEDQIFPDAPREQLVGEAAGRAGGKGGGLARSAAPKPGVGAVAKQERGSEIQGAAGQAQGELTAKEKEHQQGEQQAKQEKQTEIDREVAQNAAKQTSERGRAAEEAQRERDNWRTEQDKKIEAADKNSEEEHTARNKEIVKARDDKDKEVEDRKNKDNERIDSEREKAEKEAEKKKEENKPSGGFFGWVADKVKSAFNAILDAVTAVFDAARKAVNSIIDTFKEWANKAIDFVRDLAIKAINVLADALIAIGDVLLAAFPELRDRFRRAIEGLRDKAIDAVNKLADGLKKAVNALLDALAAGLNKLLDVLEAGLKAVIKAYQAVILGAIKFAQAAIEALGKFAALVADIAPDPGGWLGKAGSSAKAGIQDHLWGAIKTGVKRWFDTKVEGILGLGKAVIDVLVKGCVSIKQIGKMAWDAIIASLPMMIASIVIEKVVSMLVPAAGAILTIVQGLMAAWQSLSSILSAFSKFWAYLKAVKAGPAACLFAEAVAAGIVALLDFITNFLMLRLTAATKGVGKRLKAMAEKIMKGLKKTGKGARETAGGAVNRARGAIRKASQALRAPVRPGKTADASVPGRRPTSAGPAADRPGSDVTPGKAQEDRKNTRPDRTPDRTPERDAKNDTAQEAAPDTTKGRPDRAPETDSKKDTAQDRTPDSKKNTEPDRTPEPDRKETEPRRSTPPTKKESPLSKALKKIRHTVGSALKKVRNAGRTLGRKLRKSRVGQALRRSAKRLHAKTLERMRRLKDLRRSRRIDEDRAARRQKQREEQQRREKEATDNPGRPTVKASFTMAGERHRMVLKPSGTDVSVKMESRLLPLEDRYRAAYNEIEFFKAYVSRIEDPETRRRFEVELLDEVSDFQVDSVKQYKAAFKEAFPHRANEPLGLTRQQQASSRARVQQLVWQLRGMNRKITRWANENGIVDLDQNEIGKTIAKKGERIWDERYRNIKKTIDGVVLRFQYKGRNLEYVGSLKNEGQRGPHKGRTAFNINDFDVDLFVVHPAEWRKWLPIVTAERPEMVSNGKIFPIWPQMRELYNLGRSVGKALTRVLRGRVKDSQKFTDETDIVLREKDSY